jgi:hypothetical protein
MRYAMPVLKEARPDTASRSTFEKVLGFLANGFVLLLIGSVITSFLVPRFQHDYEQRRQRIATMQECFSQFLLYGNSIWQEYYAILPLSQQREIDRTEYLQYIGKIADIKLKRYDAFATGAKPFRWERVHGRRVHDDES